MITRSKLNLKDNIFNVGDLTSFQDESSFNIEKSETRLLPYKNQFWNAITFEMSLTRHEFTRITYGLFDFLRDIGGLFSALRPISAVLVAILQYRGAYYYLTSEMMLNKRSDSQNLQIQRIESGKTFTASDWKKIPRNCCRVSFANLQINCP